MQAIVTNDREFNVIECNPRFGGASTTGIAAGLKPFHWSFLEAVGEDINSVPFFRRAENVRQIRFPQDFYVIDPCI
jgi:carbamoyl-phosphate synthase large subunit